VFKKEWKNEVEKYGLVSPDKYTNKRTKLTIIIYCSRNIRIGERGSSPKGSYIVIL
jgi:hypothetical protein